MDHNSYNCTDDKECRYEINDAQYSYDKSDRCDHEEFFPEYERFPSELFYRETGKTEDSDEFRKYKTENEKENSEYSERNTDDSNNEYNASDRQEYVVENSIYDAFSWTCHDVFSCIEKKSFKEKVEKCTEDQKKEKSICHVCSEESDSL